MATQQTSNSRQRSLPQTSHRRSFPRASQREEYIRVRERDGQVIHYDNQSSGVLFSTSWGDGLLRQNIGETLSEGATVDYFPWSVFN